MAKSLKDAMDETKDEKPAGAKGSTTSPIKPETPVKTEESTDDCKMPIECAIVKCILDEIGSRRGIGGAMSIVPNHIKLDMVKKMHRQVADIIVEYNNLEEDES